MKFDNEGLRREKSFDDGQDVPNTGSQSQWIDLMVVLVMTRRKLEQEADVERVEVLGIFTITRLQHSECQH